MRNYWVIFCIVCLISFLSGCATSEMKYSYTGISGASIKSITEEFLRERQFTVQTDQVTDYTTSGKSEIRTSSTLFGREILEWDEITIIARESHAKPVSVDLLVQVQVWRKRPLGEKELVKSVSNLRRLEGEQALRELDELIRTNGL